METLFLGRGFLRALTRTAQWLKIINTWFIFVFIFIGIFIFIRIVSIVVWTWRTIHFYDTIQLLYIAYCSPGRSWSSPS